MLDGGHTLHYLLVAAVPVRVVERMHGQGCQCLDLRDSDVQRM
jgi:hypothetical protein